jgi:hypothetical protein
LFLSAGCSLLRAEGINELQFSIKKKIKKISSFIFFFSFGHQNPVSGLDPNTDLYPNLYLDSLEMLDPDLFPQLCRKPCGPFSISKLQVFLLTPASR